MNVVDTTLDSRQNAERPGGNRAETVWMNQPPKRAESGNRHWSQFQHVSAANARGMSMTPPDDDEIGARSPSGWHDDAMGRDAGHDQMQARLLRVFDKERMENFRPGGLVWCGAEYPIRPTSHHSSRVLAFADIALQYEIRAQIYAWRFIELKPRIYSCGGLIRQCVMIGFAAERAGIAKPHVQPCVYDDDPKLSLLAEMYRDVLVLRRELADWEVAT